MIVVVNAYNMTHKDTGLRIITRLPGVSLGATPISLVLIGKPYDGQSITAPDREAQIFRMAFNLIRRTRMKLYRILLPRISKRVSCSQILMAAAKLTALTALTLKF